jgi:CheY-like chemotaxis protein/HPt (histidine-containing phosphotransfer) domain-containing protein
MMGGDISVESEYGKGTVFRIRILQGFIDDATIGPVVAENLRNFRYAEKKHIVTKKFIRPDLSHTRVLVVDDMQTNLDVASGLLRKYKMQVDCVTSGQEAVNQIRQGNPVYNAIFMDHMMPGMDGIEAANAIRGLNTEYSRAIPIIALTANAIHGTEHIFYASDFQAFISKPIDIMQLDSVVRKWVRNDLPKKISQDTPAFSAVSEERDTAIRIPRVDTEKGLSLYGDEMDIYLEVLRSYVLNTPAVLDKIRNVSEETLQDYAINVHGIKGTSANIGAEEAREAAFSLEKMAKASDLNGVLTINDSFIKDTENVIAGIKTWLDQYDTK